MVSDRSQGMPLEDIQHKKSNRRDTNIYFLGSPQKSALVWQCACTPIGFLRTDTSCAGSMSV